MSFSIIFAAPRKLPSPEKLNGRIVLLDIAFCSEGLKPSYEEMTLPFIRKLDGALAAWVDHHDHPRQKDWAGDKRFILATKAEHRACPEMITPEIIKMASPWDTIVCHLDLDGLYSASKWILEGKEPYPGADSDAAAIDSRLGSASDTAVTIDMALRANFRDDQLKFSIIKYLTSSSKSMKKLFWEDISSEADRYRPLFNEALKLARKFEIHGNLAFVRAPDNIQFDKTELLLEGQKLAPISAVEYCGNITVAAASDSGIDLLSLLNIRGGMPTRVTVPSSMGKSVFEALSHPLKQT